MRRATSSFGDEVLKPPSCAQVLERLRLLYALQDERAECKLLRRCREEALLRVESGSARAFVRKRSREAPSRIPAGCDAEVYFLGSEADCVARPELFADCWLRTNSNIELVPVDASIFPGDRRDAWAHKGFQDAYLRVAAGIRAALSVGDEEGVGGLRVAVMGYSLGGALATLATIGLASSGARVELFTCGSPRVGNVALLELVQARLPDLLARTARLVNTLYPVPHVPFSPEDAGLAGGAVGRLWQSIEGAGALPQDPRRRRGPVPPPRARNTVGRAWGGAHLRRHPRPAGLVRMGSGAGRGVLLRSGSGAARAWPARCCSRADGARGQPRALGIPWEQSGGQLRRTGSHSVCLGPEPRESHRAINSQMDPGPATELD